MQNFPGVAPSSQTTQLYLEQTTFVNLYHILFWFLPIYSNTFQIMFNADFFYLW